MRRWRLGPVLLATGWGSAVVITALDLWGLPGAFADALKLAAG
jgi:hypothetical protein